MANGKLKTGNGKLRTENLEIFGEWFKVEVRG